MTIWTLIDSADTTRPARVRGASRARATAPRSLARLGSSVAVFLAVFATLAGSAFAGGISAAPIAPARAYVGSLSGTSAFVAVLVGQKGDARAYVYDSTTRIAAWFAPATSRALRFESGATGANSLSVTSKDGYRLHATAMDGHASGSVRYPSGEHHPFSAARVDLPDGLYQIEIGHGLTRYFGGWIVWEHSRSLGYLQPAPVVLLAPRENR